MSDRVTGRRIGRGGGLWARVGRTRIMAGAGVLALVATAALAGAWSGPTTTIAPPTVAELPQDAEEAVMVAAGAWALDRLPAGQTRLDPHRSGAGKDAARVRRVAQALGAGLGTLDESRQCTDTMDPATCKLSVDRLLAISAPRVDGDEARVKVYAWYRSSSPPVAQQSWDLVLRHSGGSWRVVSGG